jgi:ABC-type sugar transport system ATPase subunit
VIGLRGVEVTAGDFSVGPLDLEVPAGEYAVLLGPSGAGKTLVLEALAGVRRVRAGRLLVDGADVTGLSPERRRVGLVFQDGLLFPHLSVADNVAYGLHRSNGERTGWRRRPSAGRLGQLAGEVGITHLLKRRPETLSGSALRWRGRSPPGLGLCSSTSPSVLSISRRVKDCRTCCAGSIRTRA